MGRAGSRAKTNRFLVYYDVTSSHFALANVSNVSWKIMIIHHLSWYTSLYSPAWPVVISFRLPSAEKMAQWPPLISLAQNAKIQQGKWWDIVIITLSTHHWCVLFSNNFPSNPVKFGIHKKENQSIFPWVFNQSNLFQWKITAVQKWNPSAPGALWEEQQLQIQQKVFGAVGYF